MKEQTNIDINTIKLLYGKYKEHIVYIIVIIVSALIFILQVLPRFEDFKRLNNEGKEEQNKFKILNNNLEFLKNINDSSLNSNFDIVTSALPQNKDFEGILSSISLASGKSGSSLSDYGFSVGDITDSETIRTSGFPFLELSLSIRGNTRQVINFINELYKSFPLSEVVSVSYGQGSSTLAVNFYYKSLPPIKFNEKEVISPISGKNAELVKKISSWRESFASPASPASESGNFSPF